MLRYGDFFLGGDFSWEGGGALLKNSYERSMGLKKKLEEEPNKFSGKPDLKLHTDTKTERGDFCWYR